MEKDRNKKIEKTKANILEALLLLLQHKEINEISIRELTETAHIHRNTFYIHYTDIYDILAEVEENMCRKVKEMTDGMEPTQLKENLEVVLESVFEYLYQEREKCGLIMRYRGSVSSGKGLVESIFVKYLNAFPNTFNEASVEFQVQFYYCTTGAMWIVRYWMEHDFKESPKRMAALTAKLLTKGIQGALEEAGRG